MKNSISKRITSIVLVILMSIGICSVGVFAQDDTLVTEIYGSANGWGQNTNWIGFKLSRELDLDDSNTDVILRYEYVENGEIKEMRYETDNYAGYAYTKNKSWSGYLNQYDPDGGETTRCTSLLPAETLIMSNLSPASLTNFTTLTSKVESGDVEFFRVRLTVIDESGDVAYDGYTNWIQYLKYGESAYPRGILYDGLPEDYYESESEYDYLDDLPQCDPPIIIGTGEPVRGFETLADAVAAAQSGDTIYIYPGVYELDETLVLDDINLVGVGDADEIIIKPSENFNPTLKLVGSYNAYPLIYTEGDVSISDLTISGPCEEVNKLWDGIVSRGDSLTLKNVALLDIRSYGDGDSDISGMQSGKAVIIADGDATITDCTIERFQKNAIDFYSAGELTVTGTTITGVGDNVIVAQNGIIVRDGSAVLEGNTISGLGYVADNEYIYGSCGIYAFGNADTVTAKDNIIQNVDNAFGIFDGVTAIIINNEIIDCHEDILLDDLNESIIYHTGTFDNLPIDDAIVIPGSIKITGSKSLAVDDSVTLGIDQTIDGVVWSSDDVSVATVDSNGVVTGVGVGTVKITASVTISVVGDYSYTLTDTVSINVTNTEPKTPGNIVITGAKSLTVGDSVTLSIEPAINGVAWSSDNVSVATVDSNGVVTGVGAGTVKITASVTMSDAGEVYTYTDTVSINVTAKPESGSTGGGGGGGGGSSSSSTSSTPVSDVTTAIDDQLTPSASRQFNDIDGHWAESYINNLAMQGYVQGVSTGVFAPDKQMTRAEFVQLLSNIFAEGELVNEETPFIDVPAGSWYAKSVAWAYENGIVNGITENNFAPDSKISRKQMAVLLFRMAGKFEIALPKAVENTPFNDDGDISDYAKEAVYAMQAANIINGKPGNLFDPQGDTTRAEVSKVIYLLLDLAKS